MKVRKPSTGRSGTFSLIYGETGVGKTTSTLKSLIEAGIIPVLYYEIDPRDVEHTLEGNISADLLTHENISIHTPEGFVDLLDELMGKRKLIESKFKAIVVDPLSFLMNVILLGEIEDETGEAEIFDKKPRPIVNMGRTDQTGYGSLASLMKRLCATMGRYTSAGLTVICTALLDDKPKWNRMLSAAPAFAGREFPRDMPGMFDAIGMVEGRTGKDGQAIYPPNVWFRSPDGEFLAKWSGTPLPQNPMPLDWGKILRAGRKGVNKGKE